MTEAIAVASALAGIVPLLAREVSGVDRAIGQAGSRVLYEPAKERHDIDFAFIHDAVPNPNQAWRSWEVDDEWPVYLSETFPSARILIYQYERTWVRSLSDIVNPDRPRKITRELLKYLENEDNKSSVPIVVFAHGFGGLLYEQAVVWSEASDSGNIFRRRRHAAFLFGTPHFGAGIAEWVIIVAKAHGIRCAKTAQAQDWSALKGKISETAGMQRQFREMLKTSDSGVKPTGCFSTLPEPRSNLTLSSEWAVLPEFMPIAVDSSHSSMTRLSSSGDAFKAIVITLKSVVQELATTSSKSTPDSINSLADRIFDNLIASVFDETHRKFLPEGFLKKFITMEVIQKELGMGSGRLAPKDERIVDFILKHARKLFATMVYCGISGTNLLTAMKSAEGSNFNDGQLPINNLGSLPRTGRPTLFQHLDRAMLNRFYEEQWSFLAPVFSMNDFSSQDYDASVILPFVSVETRANSGGSHGIRRFGIPPSHLGRAENDLTSAAEYVVICPVEKGQGVTNSIKSSWDSIPEYMVRPIAAFTMKGQYYIMSQGSLQDYWELSPRKNPSVEIMREFLHQLRELVQSLEYMPLYDLSYNLYRGPEPENMLKYPARSSSGTLKPALGDVTRSQSSGRRYDSWSMGCVILEAVICILYGYNEVEKLRHSAQSGSPYSLEEKVRFEESIKSAPLAKMIECSFSFSYLSNTKDGEKVEASALITWIQQIRRNEPEYRRTSSAIRDVLDLVQSSLLKTTQKTLDAKEDDIPSRLDSIIEKAMADKKYAFSEEDHGRIPTSSSWPLAVAALETPPPPYPGRRTFERHEWQFIVDNDFAEQAMRRLYNERSFAPSPTSKDLCDTCRELNFLDPTFRMSETVSSLRVKATHCPLCKMLLVACKKIDYWDEIGVCAFERIGSNIHLVDKLFPPVLSLSRNLDLLTSPHAPIQIGFPRLPANGEGTFEFIKTWLEDCDKTHSGCRQRRKVPMPKRLVDVSEGAIRLCELEPDDGRKYIALSHVWGKAPRSERHFMTLRSNIERYKQGILFDDFPRMFQDAVKTTRGLGIQYLWIDALCVIFDQEEDFRDMAMTLEEVFSGAYCVLAASRASSQSTGFLGPRPEREFITLPDKTNAKGQLYLCAAIDDFNRDVLQSPLQSRAWVLQERVAARRSVFFTENQLYLECGGGIRCETLSLMHNQTASFLGDPEFPSTALKAPLIDRINLFQSLYSYYSRLLLSESRDRPLAIAAIEKRLEMAFESPSRNGVFEGSLLHCSLLWCRNIESNRLREIPFLSHRVPSWSWQAHHGIIDYITPAWDTVDWNASIRIAHDDSDGVGLRVLGAQACTFDFDGKEKGDNFIVYDDPEDAAGRSKAKCVVLGQAKESTTPMGKKCFVLVVAPIAAPNQKVPITAITVVGASMYRRIGAGILTSLQIIHDELETKVEIL